jgi:glycosyltransferase involved in cell wall biosynthesis
MEKNAGSALSPQAWKHLEKLKSADILVGIPSYNNAHTINYVVYQAAKGLETYFPNLKSAIFVSDGNSTDGTLESVKAMRFPFQVSMIPTTYVGILGKGSAVKAIFEAARFLEVKAVALVDSDLRSITAEWVKLLISPALNGTGFVTPFYVRHKYDGTITNFLCYPVTSSLYGKKIRQPIGGDFGLSIELVQELLESPLWQMSYVRRFGIDIFETNTALAGNFDVKQAFLGKKVHEAKDPSEHLASMFKQVSASLFTCTERYEEVWKKIRGFQEVEIVGEQMYIGEPERIRVDLKNLMRTYKEGFSKNERIYRSILSKESFKEIEGLKELDDMGATFFAETWTRIVYSFCASFKNEKRFDREKLLDAFRILWIGKIATFVKETLELDTMKAEKKIEEEVRVFERFKSYLLDIF